MYFTKSLSLIAVVTHRAKELDGSLKNNNEAVRLSYAHVMINGFSLG